MQLGLVTYMWGADWDLPTLIKNLQLTGFAGVELRSGHKHGVEPSLSADDRKRVAAQFAESGVELVGLPELSKVKPSASGCPRLGSMPK